MQAVLMQPSEEAPTATPYANCKHCGEILYRALHVYGDPVCSPRCALEFIEGALIFREGESDD